MPIPTFDDMMLPIIKLAADGQEHSLREAIDHIGNTFKLSEAEKEQLHPSGQPVVYSRTAWSIVYLKNALLLESTRMGYFKITQRGLDVLGRNPARISKKYLMQFAEYAAYVGARPVRVEMDVPIPMVSISDLMKSVNKEKAKFDPHTLENPPMIRIREVINRVENSWRLPSFQRYFDWNKEKVRSLLESIFKDYFVGSFLVWKVNGGPQLELINIDGVLSHIPHVDSIILDGQQRMTSLYWAIMGPRVGSKPEKSPRMYFYVNFGSLLANLGDDQDREVVECVRTKYDREECYKRLIFPFRELPNYTEWVDGLEDYLCQSKPKISDDDIRMIRRTVEKRLRHIWDGYSIPYISLPSSMTLRQVTDVFEGLNTSGKRLGVFDLLIARTLMYGIPLRKLWDDSRKTHHDTIQRYYDQNQQIPYYMIQSMSLYYDKISSCKKEDLLNIFNRVYKDSGDDPAGYFKQNFVEFADFTSRAIRQLEDRRAGFGSLNEKETPFGPVIPVLAALMKEIDTRKDKANCNEKLDVWYWASVFSNAYSRSVDTRMSSDFREMRKWFDNDNEIPIAIKNARESIDRLDLKQSKSHSSAIYRGVLSLLVLEGARDFDENREVNETSSYHVDHLFPRAMQEIDLEESKLRFGSDIECVLNVTWMTKATNQRIKGAKKPSLYLKELLTEKYGNDEEKLLDVLKTHLINKNAYQAMLRDEDGFEQFLIEREKEVKLAIKKKLGMEINESGSVTITPTDPFGNIIAYQNAISHCDGYIKWVDRWFSPQGLKFLATSVNGATVREIKILTSIEKVNEDFRDLFKAFRESMTARKISAELRVLDPKLRVALHDRWMISTSKKYNLPSPDTVMRGQWSEIRESESDLPFDQWWNEARDIIADWNEIKRIKEKP